jgi:uncharacterized metal-binding protein
MSDTQNFTCANCTVGNCASLGRSFPDFCPTAKMGAEEIESSVAKYLENPADRKIALTVLKMESDYNRLVTRVEETLIFVKRMGYKKVGVATCLGLLSECNQFARAAKAYDVNLCGVACKIGAIDKTKMGLAEEDKIVPNAHESMCNPIKQAEYLNREKTDFNIIIGLCVGHDTLFIKHSKAPVTYLIVKDRVLCHNPVGALYTVNSFYNRLLNPELLKPRQKPE